MWDAKLDAYVDAVIGAAIRPSAQGDVRNALALIARGRWSAFAQPLQLLALRRYLRMQNREHKDIHARWAWTPAEARKFEGHGLAQALLDAAEVVKRKFTTNNPGYSLGLSPLRTLERQVGLWNGNVHVRNAATKLHKEMLATLSDESFPLPPNSRSVEAFIPLLQDRGVHPEPTSAAPGTSDHGHCAPSISWCFKEVSSWLAPIPRRSRRSGKRRAGKRSSSQRLQRPD